MARVRAAVAAAVTSVYPKAAERHDTEADGAEQQT
jgi:hypothetical protein